MKWRRTVILLILAALAGTFFAIMVLMDRWGREAAQLPTIARAETLDGRLEEIAEEFAGKLRAAPELHGKKIQPLEPTALQGDAAETMRDVVLHANALFIKRVWERFENAGQRPVFIASEDKKRAIIERVRRMIEESEEGTLQRFDRQTVIESGEVPEMVLILTASQIRVREGTVDCVLTLENIQTHTTALTVQRVFYRPDHVSRVAAERERIREKMWIGQWAAGASAGGFGLVMVAAVVGTAVMQRRAAVALRQLKELLSSGVYILKPDLEEEVRRLLPHSAELRKCWDLYLNAKSDVEEVRAAIEAGQLERATQRVQALAAGPARDKLVAEIRARVREHEAAERHRIESQVAELTRLVGAGRLAEALPRVEEMRSARLQLPAGEGDGAANLAGRIESLHAEAERRRTESAQEAEQARECLKSGDVGSALARGRRALELNADNAVAADLVRMIESSRAETSAIRALVAGGHLDEAERRLSALPAECADGAEPLAGEIRQKRTQAQALLLEAQRLLCDAKLAEAQSKAAAAHRLDADDPDTARWLGQIEAAAKAIDEANRRLSAADLSGADAAVKTLGADMRFLAAAVSEETRRRRLEAQGHAEAARMAVGQAEIARARHELAEALRLDKSCGPAAALSRALDEARADRARRLVCPTVSRPALIHARPSLTVGRKDADLTIPHPEVSARHLELSLSDHQLFAQDLKSRNGSFLAGQEFTGARVAVEDGMIIRLGGHENVLVRIYRDSSSEAMAAAVDRTLERTPTSKGGHGSGSGGKGGGMIGAVALQLEKTPLDALIVRTAAPLKASAMGLDLDASSAERIELRDGALLYRTEQGYVPLAAGQTIKISGFEFKVEAV